MKTKARQFEFPVPDEPFALVGERAEDGDRIAAGREESARDQEESARRQPGLFDFTRKATHTMTP